MSVQGTFNPTWHKLFFGGLDMGGELEEPPPGNCTLGTFMSSKKFQKKNSNF